MEGKLDSINIELIVKAAQFDENDIWMQGDLEILINEKKPYGESDIIDIDIFLESLKSDGEYFIFSCNCGIPECNGWIKGINVTHNEKTITWTNGNTNDTWSFEKIKIENDLNEIRNEVQNYKKYFSEKGIKYVGIGYSWN